MDTAVDSLRAALRQIENEEKQIALAKQRILKALHVFVQDDGSIPVSRAAPRTLGPRRYDSHTVVMGAVKVHRVPDKEFSYQDVKEWTPELRKGQLSSALSLLAQQGHLIRIRKGLYKLPPKEGNGNGV